MTMNPNAISKTWYVDAFGDQYLSIYRHRSDDAAMAEIADLFAYLNLQGTERILDVCCGNARHLAAMRRLGFDAYGMDLSPQLLAEASTRPEADARVVRADIRFSPFVPRFDVVTNLFSSFGYFDEVENVAAFRELARGVVSGGILVLDHANRTYVKATLEPQTVEHRDDVTIHHRRSIEGDYVVKLTTVRESDGTQRTQGERLRLYRETEMQHLFQSAGFVDIRSVGSFTGTPLTPDSPRMITIGVKA